MKLQCKIFEHDKLSWGQRLIVSMFRENTPLDVRFIRKRKKFLIIRFTGRDCDFYAAVLVGEFASVIDHMWLAGNKEPRPVGGGLPMRTPDDSRALWYWYPVLRDLLRAFNGWPGYPWGPVREILCN